MKKLYVVAASEQRCYSLATDHGITSDKIVPVWRYDQFTEVYKTPVFVLCTSDPDPDSINIRYAAYKVPEYKILEDIAATEFIKRFQNTMARAVDAANNQAISMDNARNIMMQVLQEFNPEGLLNFGVGRVNNRITVYSSNEWTAGLMTFIGAH